MIILLAKIFLAGAFVALIIFGFTAFFGEAYRPCLNAGVGLILIAATLYLINKGVGNQIR